MNITLTDAVLDILCTDPQRHDQDVWISPAFSSWNKGEEFTPEAARDPECGTTACIAGWAVLLSLPAGSVIDSRYNIRLPDGTLRFIPYWARDVLEITDEQADTLFHDIGTTEGAIRALKYLKDHPFADDGDLLHAAGEE
jgi:hypothetical protein